MATIHPLQPRPVEQPAARILVVDDDLDTVHSMALLLKAFGHDVEFAINGFAAVDIARRFRPEVIIIDVNLPDFAGDKLARQLKYDPGLERARIIAVSGDEAARQRALDAGCVEFQLKPIAPKTLEALIAKYRAERN